VPLRCFDPRVNSSIHAFDLSPEAWQALEDENRRERHLRMPCCLAQVTLRKSRRGTQFFAHKAIGECVTTPETEAHLRLKRMAVEVARANGWEAETEVTEGEWRADVLARKGTAKVAVEIQWSPQTNEETMRRQARYVESGVRCLWLLRQGKFPVNHSLPAARIGTSLDEGFVAFVPTGSGEQTVPMRDFLGAAFTKRLRFGVPLGFPARVSVRAGRMFCWKCGAETQIITGIDVLLGPNEYRFSVPDFSDFPDLFEFVRPRLPNDLRIGDIKRRSSKAQERSYLSNACAHCDAFIGEFYEHDAWDDQREVCTFTVQIDERWRKALEANDGHEEGWGVYP
jgi:Competence protein CoiA-like family